VVLFHLFLDESGECSFSEKTGYKYFLIVILSVEDSEIKRLKTISKRFSADMIKTGWKKETEIKAVNLSKNKKFGEKYTTKYLNAVSVLDTLKIGYIAVNKNNITNLSFRNSPYGVGYNYFTGLLLSELMFTYQMNNIHLIYDERNKESHPNQIFQQYLQTKILGMAFENDAIVNAEFVGANSSKVYGLMAVDFFCWGIYRLLTTGENRYVNIFKDKIIYKKEI
jgi:hypothetical protein